MRTKRREIREERSRCKEKENAANFDSEDLHKILQVLVSGFYETGILLSYQTLFRKKKIQETRGLEGNHLSPIFCEQEVEPITRAKVL